MLKLVNIYEGRAADPQTRQKIVGFSHEKNTVSDLCPEGRDEAAYQQFEGIKKEWKAECGFVSGDAQWDGVLSVAETLFGFMGTPERDWLYSHSAVRSAGERFKEKFKDVKKIPPPIITE